MADESWPFDNQLIDENAWEVYHANLAEDSIFGSPGSSSAQVYADGSGMQVKRRPGSGWVHGWYWRDKLEKLLPVAANSNSQPRLDLVVLRRDLVANTTTTVIKQGTPGLGAAAPALTQTEGGVWELPLAQVRVEAGAGAAGNPVQSIDANKISDSRPFVALRLWRVTNLTQLPTVGVPLWQEAVDAIGNKVRWNGSAWVNAREVTMRIDPVQLAKAQLCSISNILGYVQGNTYYGSGTLPIFIGDSSAQRIFLPGLPVPASGFEFQPACVTGDWGRNDLRYSRGEGLWFLEAAGATSTFPLVMGTTAAFAVSYPLA